MKVSGDQRETVAQIRADANAWYERQVETLQRSLGPAWTVHEAWVCDYLKGELRERLIARGWRPKDAR